MKTDRNAFKAGLFIIITVLLIVGVILSIKGAGALRGARQTRVAAFRFSDDVGGLRVGDEVRVGGYKVGTVSAVTPVDLESPDPQLLVTFSIPDQYKLREDARVRVQTTLTGTSVLNIESLGTGASLAEGARLAGKPDPKTVLLASLGEAGGDLAAIARDVRGQTLPRVNATVDKYKETSEAATALVRHLDAKVDPAVEKYNTVADKTGGMMDSVRDMIGPSTTDWKGTIANLNQITTDVKGRLPGLLTKVEASVDSASKALSDIEQTVANTKDVSATLKGVIGGNRGKLEDMVASLKTTSDNLKSASSEIRRSPWRLLYQPKQDELNNLNLYDSARQFAEGANDLNDAAQALRDAVNSGQTDPKELQQRITELDKTFQQFRQVEDQLWKGVK